MLLIKAEPSEYVEDVKEKICSRKSIPVKRQILSLDGIVLDDAKTLHSLGIMDGSTLQLVLMEVQLRLQIGGKVSLAVNCEDSVLRLKRRLKDHTDIAIENQYLRFGGQKMLENTRKLSFYSIDLVIRLS